MADDKTAADRLYTTKQMGDACEMLVAAELTLAGIPALKVADNWPGYDVVAKPPHYWRGYATNTDESTRAPQRISVKSRTMGRTKSVVFDPAAFDWLAIMILEEGGNPISREIFIMPSDIAQAGSYPRRWEGAKGDPCGLTLSAVRKRFTDYKDNFKLERFSRASLTLGRERGLRAPKGMKP